MQKYDFSTQIGICSERPHDEQGLWGVQIQQPEATHAAFWNTCCFKSISLKSGPKTPSMQSWGACPALPEGFCYMMGGLSWSNSHSLIILLHPLHISLPGCFFTTVLWLAPWCFPSLLRHWAGVRTVGRNRFFVLCSLPQITGKASRGEKPDISFRASCSFSPFH